MAVSKRVRYEVLKRDNHTCRYCHAADLPLTVDHVVPTALGGTDRPDNLVAACRDCNAGKASTSPDASTVEDVKQVDLMWGAAIKRVATARARQRKKRDAYVVAFLDAWNGWTHGWREDRFPPPASYESSIARFYDLGVPVEDIRDCVRIACSNERVSPDETYRYFAGCVWRVVTEMQDAAKEMVAADDGGPHAT